jgi:hypothetical protein
MRALPTPTLPPGQAGGLVWIEETAVARLSRLALRNRRGWESPLHGPWSWS